MRIRSWILSLPLHAENQEQLGNWHMNENKEEVILCNLQIDAT